MFLLDTNHCSRILERDPDIIAQIRAHKESLMATSVITEGELVFMVQGSERKAENFQRVSAFLAGIRVYEIDSETAAIYGVLKAIYTHGLVQKRRRNDGMQRSPNSALMTTTYGSRHLLSDIASSSSQVTMISSAYKRFKVSTLLPGKPAPRDKNLLSIGRKLLCPF